MSQLLILSCSQRKRIEPYVLAAIERYDGPAFRIVRRFLKEQPSRKPDIYILSARFGLISSYQPIPYYDQRMTLLRARELQPSVIAELRTILSSRSYQQLCICAGADYLPALDGYPMLLSPRLALTIIAGSPGKLSAKLYNWLHGETPSQKSASPAHSHQNKSCIRGIEVTLTAEQVLDIARQALKESQKQAENYVSWYVPLDGHRIAPKWLVSRLTGLPVSAFATDEARRLLARLGIEVKRV